MDQTPSPRAGGAIIAASVTIGAIIGAIGHQPSLGFIIGLGIGVAIAVAIWVVDRKRTG